MNNNSSPQVQVILDIRLLNDLQAIKPFKSSNQVETGKGPDGLVQVFTTGIAVLQEGRPLRWHGLYWNCFNMKQKAKNSFRLTFSIHEIQMLSHLVKGLSHKMIAA